MNARYVLRKDASINRIIMRIEKFEEIPVRDRFDGRQIILNDEDANDRKIIHLITSHSLLEKMERLESDDDLLEGVLLDDLGLVSRKKIEEMLHIDRNETVKGYDLNYLIQLADLLREKKIDVHRFKESMYLLNLGVKLASENFEKALNAIIENNQLFKRESNET